MHTLLSTTATEHGFSKLALPTFCLSTTDLVQNVDARRRDREREDRTEKKERERERREEQSVID